MKKLLTLIVISLATFPVAANDETAANCGPTEKVFKHYVEKFDASATVAGQITSDGRHEAMTIWQTKDASQWALVVTKPNGYSCVVAGGTNLRIVPYKAIDL